MNISLLEDSSRLRAVAMTPILGALFLLGCSSCSNSAALPGTPLSGSQRTAVAAAIAFMHQKGLTSFVKLADAIESQGKWRAALPTDQYLAESEKSGDTPFAYTLPDTSDPHRPVAIVLAPRFFTDADPVAQAALMIHEMGHWEAFVKTGKSTEYDGYKTEFDNHKRIGLTAQDGLTYFMMLDGVVENVVPRDKRYADDAEIVAYNKQ